MPTPSHSRNGSVRRIPCAIVRSGTSRFIVVSALEHVGKTGLDEILLQLILGESPIEALGGDHYQSNKIIVIHRDSESLDIPFRFFQVDKSRRRVLHHMECGNGAAAAAMFCILNGDRRALERRPIRLHNLGTGQKIDLTPPYNPFVGPSDWSVNFTFESSKDTPEVFLDSSVLPEQVSAVEIVSQGNLFLLVETRDLDLARDATLRLEKLAYESIVASGRTAWPEGGSKIILYQVKSRRSEHAQVSARCIYDGHVHHSIPGSGAICLVRTLTKSLLKDDPPSKIRGVMRFGIQNPGGETDAMTRWKRIQNRIIVCDGAFQTPVRLLLFGEVYLSMQKQRKFRANYAT